MRNERKQSTRLLLCIYINFPALAVFMFFISNHGSVAKENAAAMVIITRKDDAREVFVSAERGIDPIATFYGLETFL